MERARCEAELYGGPERPPAGDYLWGWFLELHRVRGGGMGPAPITFQDLEAWARMRALRLAPWEVEVIQDLDTTWMNAQAEATKKG